MEMNNVLEKELLKMYEATSPEGKVAMKSQMDNLISTGIMERVINEGDDIPDFTLPDQTGNLVDSISLLAKGPLVISFYRGAWCPYCNIELQALQAIIPEIHELGAELIAISPNKPDEALTLQEKYDLDFRVLSDKDNLVAKQFGLVYQIEEYLWPLYKKLGADLVAYNGNDKWELPIAATYVVDHDGVIISYIDVDWTKRMEPIEIIRALDSIRV